MFRFRSHLRTALDAWYSSPDDFSDHFSKHPFASRIAEQLVFAACTIEIGPYKDSPHVISYGPVDPQEPSVVVSQKMLSIEEIESLATTAAGLAIRETAMNGMWSKSALSRVSLPDVLKDLEGVEILLSYFTDAPSASSESFWDLEGSDELPVDKLDHALACLGLAVLDEVMVRLDAGDVIDAMSLFDAAVRFEREADLLFQESYRERQRTASVSRKARAAALARHKSPTNRKARAKEEIRDLWNSSRQDYKSSAQFALAMLERFPILTSTKNIEKWCTDWSKSAS